jgi:hypothetical protein
MPLRMDPGDPPCGVMMCSRCREVSDRPKSHICTKCHNSYQRKYRSENPLSGEARRRDSARSYAGVYKRRGKLTPQPCVCCGEPEAEMHHPDYELPLEVVWLCSKHHDDWHAFFRGAADEMWKFWLDGATAAAVSAADVVVETSAADVEAL